MILKILLIIFCIIIGLLLVLLFSPIVFTYDSKSKTSRNAVLSIHFLYPAIASITYFFSVKKYEIVLVGKFVFGSFKKSAHSDSEEHQDVNDERIVEQGISHDR